MNVDVGGLRRHAHGRHVRADGCRGVSAAGSHLPLRTWAVVPVLSCLTTLSRLAIGNRAE